MQATDFVFRLTPYDKQLLLPQVSRALETWTEQHSRQAYPGLWRVTDRLWNVANGRQRSRLRTRILGIVCLILGIVLLVPGLMDPQELEVPLVTGAVAVGAGIGGLWRSRKRRSNPFDKSASALLAGLYALPEGQELQVAFSSEGMMVTASGQRTQTVPWDRFECGVETADALLLVYGEQATLLQKKDLVDGTQEAFQAFLASRIQVFTII